MLESTVELRKQPIEAESLLDAAYRRLLHDESDAVSTFIDSLSRLKMRMPAKDWKFFANVVSREHPVHKVCQEDPFTSRAFCKPRGYAGDAVLMDYIYAGLPAGLARDTSYRGRKIFEHTANLSGSARAVRDRRNLMASTVDRVAGQIARPRVLSVACGHLREALWTRALPSGAIGEYIGLDQDVESLEIVERDAGPLGVVPKQGSVRDLMSGRLDLGTFDLIYSAGLYDYLSDESARCLTRVLMNALRPGGELLVANFVPGFATSAYMECFMDWKLICRDRRQMLALVEGAPDVETRAFCDDGGYVAYLSICKKHGARC